MTREGGATADSCVKKASDGRRKRERDGRRGAGSRKTYETDEIMGRGGRDTESQQWVARAREGEGRQTSGGATSKGVLRHFASARR